MGHSKAERAINRERILSAASMRIREAGLESLTVREVMKSVNLTQGGFYGHFASRADLIAAGLERALTEGEESPALYTATHGSASVKSIVNSYLSPAHRDRSVNGCAISALAGEVGRSDPQVRAIMAEQLDRLIEIIAAAFGDAEQAEPFAEAAWATMIGGIVLSRVYADKARADAVLASTRRAILDLEALYKVRSQAN